MSWSGGKDSSYALHKVLQEGSYDVKYLLNKEIELDITMEMDLKKNKFSFKENKILR